MLRTMKSLLIAAAIGLGTLSGVSAASAEGIYFGMGQSGARHGLAIGDGPRHSGSAERWHRDRRDRDRHGWRHRGCSAEQALQKARWLGLRRARIVDMDRRGIDVVGRRHGERIHMTFARAPRCPVVL